MRGSSLPPLTGLPPYGEDRFRYTYYGHVLIGPSSPCYLRDDVRSRPTLVLGTTGSGKTEGMLSRAFQDACKGRPVVFIDGKCDSDTWNKLYYYNHVCAGRPFYALFPSPMLDRLTMSWNPLHSTLLPIHTVVESFFNTYTRGKTIADASEFYYETQRTAFTLLCQALHASGWGFNLEDLSVLLEYDSVLDSLQALLPPEAMPFYVKLISYRNQEDGFSAKMRGFLNFLKRFDHWSLNSYNPEIQLDRLYFTDATIYIGLPVNSQQVAMSTIGNLLINQLRALSNYVQAHFPQRWRDLAVYIDEAGPFIDTALGEWIGKVRSSGFMTELGVQTLADLSRINRIIGEQVKGNTPNILLYNPQDLATARSYSELMGSEEMIFTTVSESEDRDGVAVTRKAGEIPKIHPDLINQLRVGQCVFRPAERIYRPPVLAGSILPPVPPAPQFSWHGGRHPMTPELTGLYMKLRLDVVKRTPRSGVRANTRSSAARTAPTARRTTKV